MPSTTSERGRWLPVLFVGLLLFFLLRHGVTYFAMTHVDLPSFYAASVEVFGHGRSPYSPEQLARVLGPEVDVFPWLYPPTSLFVFWPLSWLRYAQAQTLVLFLNHVLLIALAWFLPLGVLRLPLPATRGEGRPGAIALCLTYVFLFEPVFVTLYNGQTNLLLLAALSGAWVSLRRGHDALGAALLTLAVLLKTYPLLLLPLLFMLGYRRAVSITLAGLSTLVLASLLLLPSGLWTEWLTTIVPSGAPGAAPSGLFSPAAVWNQGLNGVFARLFTESEWSQPLVVSPVLARVLTWLSVGGVGLATAAVTWRVRAWPDALDRVFRVALPALFLVAPLSWEHHLVYTLPSVLMLLLAVSRQRWLFSALVVVAAAVLAPEALLPLKGAAMALVFGLSVSEAVTGGVPRG